MKHWVLLLTLIVLFPFAVNSHAEDLSILSETTAKKALDTPHFPARQYTFVWRNWNLAPVERLAKVLEVEPAAVEELAQIMQLPPAVKPVWTDSQIYITLLRRNWHILPYRQMLVLLNMTAEKLAFNLKEDDFLFIKLGGLKPFCEPLVYHKPTDAEKARIKTIVSQLQEEFKSLDAGQEEPRFQFIKNLKQTDPNWKPKEFGKHRFSIRYIYSYFALFGDPLFDDKAELYPDGLLQKLADHGVNGVWLHVVLHDLAPGGPDFPELGAGHEKRVANLKKLAQRAKRFGISIYLYMNEPRTLSKEFFKAHPDVTGAPSRDNTLAMCVSTPKVQNWLRNSLTYLFHEIPELGGIFTITSSENQTHCASHGDARKNQCSHCASRTSEEIIADVNRICEEGVHRGNPNANVIVWDWGWKGNAVNPEIINKLPKNVWLMSVSEWSLPLNRGGVKTSVGEYSISAVGPGPRATQQWKFAREQGIKAAAKVQFNTTWEIGSVPYIPAMNLVAQHCRNLATSGVDAVQLSWSLGGYPSMNLMLPLIFDRDPLPTVDEALDELATRFYGKEGAPLARQGWTLISRGFEEFPFAGAGTVYASPVHVGPSNLLYSKITGYNATMVGIPYDDFNSWRGPFPPEVFASQFDKTSNGFLQGADLLDKAVKYSPESNKIEAKDQARMARTIGVHYKSVANQTRFANLRNELLQGNLSQERKTEIVTELKKILRNEIELAKSLYTLCREDSRIGFESTNHYWFVPSDLREKVVNCRYLLDLLDKNGTF